MTSTLSFRLCVNSQISMNTRSTNSVTFSIESVCAFPYVNVRTCITTIWRHSSICLLPINDYQLVTFSHIMLHLWNHWPISHRPIHALTKTRIEPKRRQTDLVFFWSFNSTDADDWYDFGSVCVCGCLLYFICWRLVAFFFSSVTCIYHTYMYSPTYLSIYYLFFDDLIVIFFFLLLFLLLRRRCSSHDRFVFFSSSLGLGRQQLPQW